jgi:hypothetical protein
MVGTKDTPVPGLMNSTIIRVCTMYTRLTADRQEHRSRIITKAHRNLPGSITQGDEIKIVTEMTSAAAEP